MNQLNLSEFDKVTKTDWLEKIKLDLKGKSLEDCYSEIDKGLILDPFASVEDIAGLQLNPIQRNLSKPLSYLKFESIELSNQKLNELILSYLKLGLEAVGLKLTESSDIENILSGVFLEMIFLDIEFHNQDQLDKYSNLLDPEKNYQANIRLVNGDGSFFQGASGIRTHIVKEEREVSLINSLTKLSKDIINNLNDGITSEKMILQMHFNDLTLRNIIKLRAMRLIWNNILSSNDLEIIPALIHASASEHLIEMDLENALIACANIYTGMLLGGADIIESFPLNIQDDRNRLALNIHHLLDHEAKMMEIIDPLSGSYAIEKTTIDLAQAVWENL